MAEALGTGFRSVAGKTGAEWPHTGCVCRGLTRHLEKERAV